MESPSVTVITSSQHELELSSSSTSNLPRSSSSSSSSQSSHVNISFSSSPPDLSPPQLLPAEQSAIVSITAPPAISSSSARLPPPGLCTREQALKSLEDSIPHTMRLRELQKSERAYQKDASWHKKAVRRLSKEVYQTVSIYAVLQGAIFTAVAQSSVFACADWWGPVGVVVLVTVGTICVVLDKLCRMGYEKEEVKNFERRQSAVYDKIALLYYEGSGCSIETLEPAHTGGAGAAPFSVHGLLVLGFLSGFSALNLVSCLHMLCAHT